MAQIVEEVYTIKLSKLVRNDAESVLLANDEFLATVEAVVQELVDNDIIVEVSVR